MAIVLTGATGYVGSLAAVALLTEEDAELFLPVRNGRSKEDTLEVFRQEMEAAGRPFLASYAERVHLVPLAELDGLDRMVQVDEVVHCAGCLDYFNAAALEEGNVRLTGLFLDRARHWGAKRFTYISTAFSSGYTEREVPEQPLGLADKDPTDYTRTKREAEWLVHRSGMHHLILRPPILIGDSRDGHYSGKNYGLYQLWKASERFLCKEFQEVFHLVGPREPVPLIHQDAFQNAFLAARQLLRENAIVNLVSPPDTLPTQRDLWDQLLDHCFRPNHVHYYARVAHVPHRELHRAQRALMALASVNIDIASHPWRYERRWLEWLQAQGLHFEPATPASVQRCLDVFLQESKPVQEFREVNCHRFPSHRTITEHYGSEPVEYTIAHQGVPDVACANQPS